LIGVVLLVTGCAMRVATPAPPAAPIVLAVVTWNMHAGRGDLPRLVDDLVSGQLAGAPVHDYVLLLQEAIQHGEHDVEAFAATRGLSAFYAPVRRAGERITGNAIVSSRALAGIRTIELPRQRQPRAAIMATIDVAGRMVIVVDAHLENRVSWLRGGLLSDTARGRQADALLAAIPQHVPSIAGGDFNTWLGPREPAWRKFAARFPDTPRQPPAPTFRDRLVLDHLFFDLPDDWAVTQLVAGDAYGSDHRPVVGLLLSR
jgi:endonuclease/exonuclease/phosphatase family metal-dependent hydrolase